MRIISVLLLIALLATVVLCARPTDLKLTRPVIKKWVQRPLTRPVQPRLPISDRKIRKLKKAVAAQEEALADLKFNLSCTFLCNTWYLCHAKGSWGGNTSGCSKPSGCVCNKFAWQK